MRKEFNITGLCVPGKHYMVDLGSRLEQMKKMVDQGQYCPGEEHQRNSPWNIAVDLTLDMSFSGNDIAGMLREYETDVHTGMEIDGMAGLLAEETSGYPFLVCRLCRIMDEELPGTEGFPDRHATWSREGFLEAVRILVSEKNTLFDSLNHKLEGYPELERVICRLLFNGERIVYNPDVEEIETAMLFGFVKRACMTVF